MTPWLKRVRAALAIGVTWAAAWAPLGAITGWITGTVLGFPLRSIATNYAVTFSVLGFVGGAIFSGVLRLAEGHRTFDHLSLPRFVAWGAIGGLALGALAVAGGLLGAGLTTLGAAIIGVSTLLGAGSAASTLAVARASEQHVFPPGGAGLDGELMAGTARGRVGPAD